MVGGLITTKLSVLMPVPSAVVTLILPVTAVAGTVTVTDVSVAPAATAATTAPIFTVGSTASLRLDPLIVTSSPGSALRGVKLSIFGVTLKTAALRASPAGLLTPNFPVVAPAGTTIRIDVADTTVKLGRATPFNRT